LKTETAHANCVNKITNQLSACFNIRKERGLKLDKEHWYKHAPQSVQTGYESKVAKLWYQQVKNDRAIPNNKLDITIHDNEKGTCMLTTQRKVRRQKHNQERG
jgi:hypothetical protein